MSSHHIVKEDQEPALILADADAAPFSVVQELLEWSPTVVVLEKSIHEVVAWGIKVDVVICRESNTKSFLELLKDQAPVKIISHSDQENPIDTALYFLEAGKYRAVNMVGTNPSSLDLTVHQFNVVVFFSGKRWSFIRKGSFQKWLMKDTTISLQTTGNDSSMIIKGLDEKGIVKQDGLIQIMSNFPFWVGEPIDD